jgi:hypothetical protein
MSAMSSQLSVVSSGVIADPGMIAETRNDYIYLLMTAGVGSIVVSLISVVN